MFQFDGSDMSLREGPQRVVRELAPVFDDWEVAVWFASPNSLLAHALPVDLVIDDLFSVVQAARADRFIARG
jgi:hypothetical protein